MWNFDKNTKHIDSTLDLERSLVWTWPTSVLQMRKPRVRKIKKLVNVMQVIYSFIQQVMNGHLLCAENILVCRSNKTDTWPAFISLQFSCRNRSETDNLKIKYIISFSDRCEGPTQGVISYCTWSWNLAHLADRYCSFDSKVLPFSMTFELFKN